jgi:hypothetical protein
MLKTASPIRLALIFRFIASAALAVGAVVSRAAETAGAEVAPYPSGYRTWAHVKSSVIGPAHANFAVVGGFQHIYANAEAMKGYRTRVFADGAVIAFDWLEMTEANGAFSEGARRQTDVMVRDTKRFAATGGWGFQRYAGSSTTERAEKPSPAQCFACHERLQKDGLVLSSYRE